MGLFLASLAIGLGTVLTFFFVMRAQATQWPPPDTPPLPRALWLSTALLLASSGTLQAALHQVRRGRTRSAGRLLLATLVLAAGFLASQWWNWILAVAAHMPPGLNIYSVTFYLLTGIHALHVIGGLTPLVITTRKTAHNRYTPTDHAGLTYCVWYWHFVDVVWLVIFGTLLVFA